MRLYDYFESGNSYKVRLMLHQQAIPFECIALDILKGETRTPEFLAINPNGRVPALVLDDGTCLAESNAILFYLAEGTECLPDTRLGRARVLQWMFFEQYSHEPYVAVLRFWAFAGMLADKAAQVPEKRERGEAALAVMEQHLARTDFFVDRRYSIADIALFAYTHVAGEGGFDLAPYPSVQAWIERVQSQPRFIPIDYTF